MKRLCGVCGLAILRVCLGAGCSKQEEESKPENNPDTEGKTLTVYSLTENGNVQFLADGFHEKYPDISVEIRYGSTEEKGFQRKSRLAEAKR